MQQASRSLTSCRWAGALLVLAGLWGLADPLFPAAPPGLRVTPWGGLHLLLSAAVLLCLSWPDGPRWRWRWLEQALALVLLASGALQLAAGLDDEPGWAALGMSIDNRLTPLAAASFMSVGIFALLWAGRRVWLMQWLVLGVAGCGWFDLLSYVASQGLLRAGLVQTALMAPVLALAVLTTAVVMACLGWSTGNWGKLYEGRDDRRIIVLATVLFLFGALSIGVVTMATTLYAALDGMASSAELFRGWQALQRRLWFVALAIVILTALGATMLRVAIKPLVRANVRDRAFLTQMIDMAPSAVLVATQDGTVRSFNHEAEALFGLPAAEAIGRSIEALFSDQTVASRLRCNDATVKRRVRLDGIHKDGRRIPMEAWIGVVSMWGRTHSVLLLADCTEQARREQMKQRCEAAFMNAAWGIAVIDASTGRLIDLNLAYARMHGYQRHELIGRPVIDTYADERQASMADHVEMLRAGEWSVFESVHRRKDGSTFPVRADMSVLRGTDGRIEMFIGNIQDVTLEKRLSDSLRESERISRLVLSVQQEMVVRWAPDTTIVFANRAYAELHGQEPEELAGQRWLDLISPLVAEPAGMLALQALIADLCRNPRRTEHALRVEHTGKGVIWVQWGVLPLFGHDQGLEGFQLTGRDITARKQMEDALVQSEQWFRGVFDSMFHHAAILDLEGRLRAVNQNGAAFVGRPAQELLGLRLWELAMIEAQPEQAERVRRAIEAARGGQNERFDIELSNAAGLPHVFDVTLRPLLGADKRTDYLVVEALDISRYRQQERFLKERDEHFHSITESMPGMVFQFVREAGSLRLTYVNQNGRKFYDIGDDRSGPVEGKSLLEFIHPDNRLEFFQRVKTSERDGRELNWVGRLNRRFDDVWINLRAVPHVGPRGRAWSGVAVDITSLKEHEQALEASRRALQELSARNEQVREDERRRLAREVHDELGQNLTALRMGLSVLGQRVEPSLLQHDLNRLKGVADTAITTVRGIVTALRPPAMDLGIAEALRWLASEFEAHSMIECELMLEADSVKLSDETATALFRIVQESLTNVTKHAAAQRVSIHMRPVGDYLVVEVCDDGKGFDVHARGKGGFGLLGMKERVLSLGGVLSINSTIGEGTVVSIQVPVDPVEQEGAE